MRPDQVKLIAKRLGVTEQDVIDMNRRLGGDASLNAPIREDGNSGEWMDWLVDDSVSQESRLAESEQSENRHKALGDALTVLNDRERRIFEARRLADEPITLEELAEEFGVSRERVRQIEVRAFEKVQKAVKTNIAHMENPEALRRRRCIKQAVIAGPSGGALRLPFMQALRALRDVPTVIFIPALMPARNTNYSPNAPLSGRRQAKIIGAGKAPRWRRHRKNPACAIRLQKLPMKPARKPPVKLVASHTPIIIDSMRTGATLVTSDSPTGDR